MHRDVTDKRLYYLVVVVLGASFLWLMFASAAQAYFCGMESDGSFNNGYTGARAWIYRYIPRITLLDKGAVAWVMLDNANVDQYHGFAQVGWARAGMWDNGSHVYKFTEFSPSTGALPDPVRHGILSDPGTYGNQDKWSVRLWNKGQANAYYEFYMDGDSIGTIDYSDWGATYWWSPTQGQWYTETGGSADQCPGDLDHYVWFGNPDSGSDYIQEYSSGDWHDLSPHDRMHNTWPSDGQGGHLYGHYAAYSNDFRTYDDRYDSEGSL